MRHLSGPCAKAGRRDRTCSWKCDGLKLRRCFSQPRGLISCPASHALAAVHPLPPGTQQPKQRSTTTPQPCTPAHTSSHQVAVVRGLDGLPLDAAHQQAAQATPQRAARPAVGGGAESVCYGQLTRQVYAFTECGACAWGAAEKGCSVVGTLGQSRRTRSDVGTCQHGSELACAAASTTSLSLLTRPLQPRA